MKKVKRGLRVATARALVAENPQAKSADLLAAWQKVGIHSDRHAADSTLSMVRHEGDKQPPEPKIVSERQEWVAKQMGRPKRKKVCKTRKAKKLSTSNWTCQVSVQPSPEAEIARLQKANQLLRDMLARALMEVS